MSSQRYNYGNLAVIALNVAYLVAKEVEVEEEAKSSQRF